MPLNASRQDHLVGLYAWGSFNPDECHEATPPNWGREDERNTESYGMRIDVGCKRDWRRLGEFRSNRMRPRPSISC